MTVRLVLAGALGLGGLALALALVARQSGPLAAPDARVELADATAAQVDTVDVRGRVVTASVGGTVVGVEPGGDVWLATGADAARLRFPEPHGLAVEDRVLATGRVRARGGRRWLAVDSWARVEASVRPPAEPDTAGPNRPPGAAR